MRLAELLIRRKALKDNIEQPQFHLTKVARAQGGDMPTEQPQELLAALEVHLQEVRALITPSNPASTRVTLPDGTTRMQIIAHCDHPNRRWGILEALMTNALPAQDHYTYSANVPADGGHSETTARGRLAVHYLLGAGRHDLEGGFRHVPAIAGSARSQAPPVPQMGHADNRTVHT